MVFPPSEMSATMPKSDVEMVSNTLGGVLEFALPLTLHMAFLRLLQLSYRSCISDGWMLNYLGSVTPGLNGMFVVRSQFILVLLPWFLGLNVTQHVLFELSTISYFSHLVPLVLDCQMSVFFTTKHSRLQSEISIGGNCTSRWA